VTTEEVNQCQTGRNKCSPDADCKNLPDKKSPGYSCSCKDGFNGNGQVCKPVVEKQCSDDFGAQLKKMKVNNLKKSTHLVGARTAIIELQTQVKMLKLNQMKYTGFVEFRKKECGTEFLKSFARDLIDISIVDKANGKMDGQVMYKVQGKRGFFHKDKKGNSDLSSAIIQFSKNFDNMKEALGDKWTNDDVEIGQSFNGKGNAMPGRDTLMLVLNSDVISKEHMGAFYETCFNPASVKFSIWGEQNDTKKFITLRGDYTECYIKNKMAKYLDDTCQSGESFATIIDSEFPVCEV